MSEVIIEKVMRNTQESSDQVDVIPDRGSEESQYADNAILDAAYMLFMEEEDMERKPKAFFDFLNVMAKRMTEEAYVPTPFMDVNNVMLKGLDVNNIKAGDTFSPQEEVRLRIDTMKDGNGGLWIPLFFNEKALSRGETANIIIPVALYDVLKIGLDREDLMGVVVDPFGKSFVLTKEILSKYLSDYVTWARQNGTQVPGCNSMDYQS